MESKGIYIVIVLMILASIGCSRIFGRYEPLNDAHYAIVVDKETRLVEDEEVKQHGPIFIRPNQCLVQFSKVGDTLTVQGQAFTKDSSLIVYSYRFRFKYEKTVFIEMYKKHGHNYKEVYYLPEIVVLTRQAVSKIENEDSDKSFRTDLENKLKKFAANNYIHFQSIIDLEILDYSGKYYFRNVSHF